MRLTRLSFYFSRFFSKDTSSLKKLLNQDQLKISCHRSLATSSILPPKVEQYVLEKAKICQPDSIHVCDGSDAENEALLRQMQKDGQVVPVKGKYKNW